MAAAAPPSSTAFSATTTTLSSSSAKSSTLLLPKSTTFPFPHKTPLHLSHTQARSVHCQTQSQRLRCLTVSNVSSISTTPQTEETFVSRFAPDEPRKGCDVLVKALEREGVTDVFAYLGGASMEIHQALTRPNIIRNVLPRHEQGGVFAVEGYARATGFPGVCIATSSPGATNLVSGLADALLDSVLIVAITGQVPRRMIGADAFQETPIVEVTGSITKHNYLELDVEDVLG